MLKILVIEDDDQIRNTIFEMLTYENFEVLEAENGQQGIELAASHRPDLILCDIMMPDLDGYGVLQWIRTHAETQTIPFIFLTAKADKVDIRLAMEQGADDYLTKPFSLSELTGAVSARLKKQVTFTQQSEQKLNELRTNLTRSLPHELLTPLNGILGFADLLQHHSQTMNGDEIEEMASEIKSCANRLHQTIRNFLLYAELELAATDPERSQELLVGYTPATEAVIKTVATELASRHQRSPDLQLELSPTPLAVAENWFQKIAFELISNAFKFSSEQTPVAITTHINPPHFSLKIINQGRGMTTAQIANVGAYMQFERKLYEQQGSGLGLIIAQRLIELYQGKLTLTSIPGEQTTVNVILPYTIVAPDPIRDFKG